METLLFLCTGNICRSPAAEALLRHRLGELGAGVKVRSAGLLEGGHPASDQGVRVLAERGIDASTHRSRPMTGADLRSADLIIGMAREHVRAAVVQAREVWPRTFTLKELVRRGDSVGPRRPGQGLAEWLAVVHEGRTTAELMGDSPDDDVADPIGQPRPAYERMVADLDELIGRMVHLLWGGVKANERKAIPWPA